MGGATVEATGDYGDTAAIEAAHLLATKLFVPRPPAGLVSRPRLVAQLDAGLDRGLTMVIAPAGFGKTALLADWISRVELPVAWLSVDAGDHDPVRFWRHVAHTLDRVCAGVAEQVEPLLSSAGPSSDTVATTVVNALMAEPADRMVVLDDYHLIENEHVHDSFLFFLESAPPDLSVVVASRVDPPIPLARWRANGKLAEVRAGDLRFTTEEAANLLRGLVGPSSALPDDAVATLATRTEGWAAGLQLAALSLRGSADVAGMVASFSGSHRFILDYLTEEVLAHQSSEMQDFLLETSVLGTLSGPLCDEAIGRTDSQQMLEAIERANLFLVPLDEVRGWWRYHQLFGDLLRARMAQQRPERVRQLHQSAAAWHDEHGILDEAVSHALAADDGATAAQLVERHADKLLMRNEDATLQRWLKVLPVDVVASQPRLLLTRARLAAIRGQVDAARELLDAAERAYPHAAGDPYEPSVGRPAGPSANVPAIIAVNRAFIANLRGDPAGATEHATRALADLGADEWMLDSLARLHIAVAGWLQGYAAAAEHTVATIIERWLAFGAHDYAVLWSSILGQIQCARGHLGAAEMTYQRALEVDLPSGQSQRPAAGAVLVGMAGLAYQHDDLETAQTHLEAALPLCRDLGYTQPLATGLALRARILQATGDPTGAEAAMTEAGRVAAPAVVDLLNPVTAAQAWLLLSQGDVDAASRLLTERGFGADDEVDYPREPAYLILVRVLLRRDRPDDALRLLDRIHAAAVEQDRAGSLIEIQALRALALAGRDDDPTAALTDALTLAQPEGYVRVFADEGRPMAGLLECLIANSGVPAGAGADYVDRLMRAFGRAGTAAAIPDADLPAGGNQVTARELEVLRLVAAGRANREIANELFISPHTVKRHITHILDKLGAGNRTEAGARARELGLLD